MRYFILFFILFSCGTDNNTENVHSKLSDPGKNTPPVITLIYESPSDSIYIISRDLTFEESLMGKNNVDTMRAGDILSLRLDENPQFLNGKTDREYIGNDFVASTGDTIFITKKGDQTEIYKYIYESRVNIIWSDSLVMSDSNLLKQLRKLRSFFLQEVNVGNEVLLVPNTKYKSEWNEYLKEYIKINDLYFKTILDSVDTNLNEGNELYIDLIKRKQYVEYNAINRYVRDSLLSARLKKEYININHLNNRNFRGVFSIYFLDTYAFNDNLLLTEAYNKELTNYPYQIQQLFKGMAIGHMDLKKYDRETILKYIEKYKEEYGTTVPIRGVLKTIEYGVVEDGDLILANQGGEEIKWEDQLKTWRGKLVYVDFWASWCAPCIGAFPSSKELQSKLKDKEVVFVYIAFNDKETAWKSMSKKQQLGENNFLILNSRSSKFVEKIKLDAIPRYMIYDQDGRLVHRDAPGPAQKEAFEVLVSYLKD